jgi:hypothetical protein
MKPTRQQHIDVPSSIPSDRFTRACCATRRAVSVLNKNTFARTTQRFIPSGSTSQQLPLQLKIRVVATLRREESVSGGRRRRGGGRASSCKRSMRLLMMLLWRESQSRAWFSLERSRRT